MEQNLKSAASPGVRRAAAWALRAVGPIVLVFLLVRVVDYGELREILRDLRYGWLVAALGAVQLIVLFRTLRWMELHAAFGLRRAPFSYQLRLTYATSLATLVLPQIVNPLSRLVLLLQDGYRTGRSLAASISEKLLDLVSYVGFGVIGSIALASTFGDLVWWAAGLATMTVAGVWFVYAVRARLGEFAARLIDRLPGLGSADADGAERRHQDRFARPNPVHGKWQRHRQRNDPPDRDHERVRQVDAYRARDEEQHGRLRERNRE